MHNLNSLITSVSISIAYLTPFPTSFLTTHITPAEENIQKNIGSIVIIKVFYAKCFFFGGGKGKANAHLASQLRTTLALSIVIVSFDVSL